MINISTSKLSYILYVIAALIILVPIAIVLVTDIHKEKGCHLIHLDTFDFQAKGFYIKHGFEVFGTLDECPQGHKRYYMKKNI